MTLPDTQPTRKQRFNAALALAGLTNIQWRREHYDVSQWHLDLVLSGEREGGPELNAAINELINKYFGDAAA